MDCITRGKYGYIDPDGKRREFTYVSGLPCEVGEEGAEEVDGEIRAEDPIDPADRFKTAQAIQLSEDEIPIQARPRQRQPLRRPADAATVRDPALASRRPVARPSSGGAGGSALTNLVRSDKAIA